MPRRGFSRICGWIRFFAQDSVQFGTVRLRAPLLVCLAWFIVLYHDGTGFALIGLLCSVWHELGHWLCYLLLFRKIPQLTISIGGIGLDLFGQHHLLWQRVLLAAAGPVMNFAAAVCISVLMYQRMSVTRAAFWAAHLLIAGFNLLPIPPLDGYQLCCCAWEFWTNKLHFRLK